MSKLSGFEMGQSADCRQNGRPFIIVRYVYVIPSSSPELGADVSVNRERRFEHMDWRLSE